MGGKEMGVGRMGGVAHLLPTHDSFSEMLTGEALVMGMVEKVSTLGRTTCWWMAMPVYNPSRT